MKNLFSLILILFFIGCSNMEKPNIIWITIEDQSQYLLPFNGNDDISLPNLQKIADESLIFENMYSVYPVCAPARSAIITGMYPNSIGTHNMRTIGGVKNIDKRQRIAQETLEIFAPLSERVGR